MKRHEKIVAAGIAIAGIGMCCLDSSGPAFICAMAVTAAGLAVAYLGIRRYERKLDVPPTTVPRPNTRENV